MSAGLQITGWPAHDSAISSVLFGPDETSIFSLGTDGKVNSALYEFCLIFGYYTQFKFPCDCLLLLPLLSTFFKFF